MVFTFIIATAIIITTIPEISFSSRVLTKLCCTASHGRQGPLAQAARRSRLRQVSSGAALGEQTRDRPITIPVTNASRQQNSRTSFSRILMLIVASPVRPLLRHYLRSAVQHRGQKTAAGCQDLLEGRLHKRCEQSNNTHSDNQHSDCYGIVVQPVQPLMHGTPPVPNPAGREDPRGNASGRLAFPVHRGLG